jgi:hypothetical protein
VKYNLATSHHIVMAIKLFCKLDSAFLNLYIASSSPRLHFHIFIIRLFL